MIYSHAKDRGQMSVGSKAIEQIQTDGRTDGQKDAIAIPDSNTRLVSRLSKFIKHTCSFIAE